MSRDLVHSTSMFSFYLEVTHIITDVQSAILLCALSYRQLKTFQFYLIYLNKMLCTYIFKYESLFTQSTYEKILVAYLRFRSQVLVFAQKIFAKLYPFTLSFGKMCKYYSQCLK